MYRQVDGGQDVAATFFISDLPRLLWLVRVLVLVLVLVLADNNDDKE